MIFQDCKQQTHIFQQKINNTNPKFTVLASLTTRFHPPGCTEALPPAAPAAPAAAAEPSPAAASAGAPSATTLEESEVTEPMVAVALLQ